MRPTDDKVAFITPTKSSCKATVPPPIPTKRQILSGNMDADEHFKSSFPSFPTLVNEDDMCDDTPLTPSAVFNESMEEDEMMYYTPTHTFNSPLSVEKFAIQRIRLKPRVSGRTYEADTMLNMDLSEIELPSLPLFSQISEESFTRPVQLSFRPSGLHLMASETF
jgi:hypothetical protein